MTARAETVQDRTFMVLMLRVDIFWRDRGEKWLLLAGRFRMAVNVAREISIYRGNILGYI